MTKFAAIITVMIFSVAGFASAASDSASFRDCLDCPKMLQIPGGDFLMGSPHSVTQAEKAPPERAKRERPVHRVRIATFALGKHEVTREQYAAFVAVSYTHLRAHET